MQYNFGVGLLTLIPAGSNPTPQQVGILQDVTLDIAVASKELYGSYQFPIDVARAAGKISGKAKFAAIRGSMISNLLGGSSIATGATYASQNEIGTIPTPSGPYTITVTNSATFVEDLGVFDTVSGVFLTRVASAPATGQYSVAAGVYTFAAADTGHLVWISYSYTAATGKTVTLTNQLMGTGNTFSLSLFNSFRSMNSGIKLFAVQVPKLSYALKNEDYTMQDLNFDAFANGAGKVLEQYTAE